MGVNAPGPEKSGRVNIRIPCTSCKIKKKEKAMAQKYISKVGMTAEDWLKDRQNYVGASETAAVLGLDRYKSPYMLWVQKTSGQKPEVDELLSQRAQAGLRAEDMIAGWLADKYGLRIQKDNKIRLHQRLPFWSCNVDRLIMGMPSGPGVLELKTTSRESLRTWNINSDEPSPIFMHHWVQVQSQMAISGYKWGAIGVMPADSFLGFGEPELIEIERDDEFIARAEEEVERFWNEHVLAMVPPKPQTEQDFNLQHGVARPPAIVITKEVYDQVVKLKELKGQKSAIEEEIKAVAFQIKMVMGDHDSAEFDGQIVVTFKNDQETVFNDVAMGSDFPHEAEQCKVISPKLVKELFPEIYSKYVSKVPGARKLLPKIK